MCVCVRVCVCVCVCVCGYSKQCYPYTAGVFKHTLYTAFWSSPVLDQVCDGRVGITAKELHFLQRKHYWG